jgi:hypothetical protein
MGQNPGPGGGAGGAAASAGGGPKPGAGATAGNGAGGGGGGFLGAGGPGGTGPLGASGAAGGGATGDVWIAKYTDNGGSGGGGGGSYLTAAGGVGGGAGGTVELTAPGNVTVGAITANGDAGGQTGGGDGGAGTGGVIVIRTGNTLTATTVSVAKGTVAGTSGASADGRVRIDAAKGAYPTGATLCVFPFSAGCNLTQGPMFVDLPTQTTTQMPAITLRGTPNDATATLRVFDKLGNPVAGPGGVSTYTPTFGTTGQASVMPTLKAGYNKVCVWVVGSGPGVDESINCQEIAYLPL